MKIILTRGCVCDGVTIDGQAINNFTSKELKEIIIEIINNISDECLNDILINLLESFGDYKYLYTCEECGDSVYEHTLNIK